MIESPLLVRIVDLLILDHPLRHAFLALAFLPAYVLSPPLNGLAWRPPRSGVAAALAWFLLSVIDLALGLRPPAEKRDLIVAVFVAAMLVSGWAWIALVRYLLRLAVAVREKQALVAQREWANVAPWTYGEVRTDDTPDKTGAAPDEHSR